MSSTPTPTEIKLHQKSQRLEISFADGKTFSLPAEFLRVYSPSAEVRGHGPGQEVLQAGKKDVQIVAIEPVGHYAVQFKFSDGHDTGIYSWDLLYDYGMKHDAMWQQYLERLKAAGASRERKHMSKTTHFGFEDVPENEKANRVAGVFESVARRYDVMNDLMSAGLHRYWKRYAIEASMVRPGERVLDVAGGTGDLTRLFSQRVGAAGAVVLTDVNSAMLALGRDRLTDEGVIVPAVQCNGERLPFASGTFDCVSVAFGLRNMTHKELALAEMHRVLRPGGRLLVLEFSQIWKPLAPLYDTYSFQVLPKLGAMVAGDAASYRYLAESIRRHPDQQTLKMMIEGAGFDRVDYSNLSAGVVALHRGFKF